MEQLMLQIEKFDESFIHESDFTYRVRMKIQSLFSTEETRFHNSCFTAEVLSFLLPHSLLVAQQPSGLKCALNVR